MIDTHCHFDMMPSPESIFRKENDEVTLLLA